MDAVVAWLDTKCDLTRKKTAPRSLISEIESRAARAGSLRALAEELLVGTGRLPVSSIDSIEDAALRLRSVRVDGRVPLLTDSTIRASLGGVPNGAEFLSAIDMDELRVVLAREHDFGDEHLGHPLLRNLVGPARTSPGALEAANRLLANSYTTALQLLVPALVAGMEVDEASRLKGFYASYACSVQPGILIAPDTKGAMDAVATYAASCSQQSPLLVDLVTVFCPSQHYTVPGRAHGGQKDLIRIVYEALLAHTYLLSKGLSPEENLANLAIAIADSEVAPEDLGSYPELYRICKTDSTRARSRRNPLPAAPQLQPATLAAVINMLSLLASVKNLSKQKKGISKPVLPNRKEAARLAESLLDPDGKLVLPFPGWPSDQVDVVSTIEVTMSRAYEEVLSHVALNYGMALPPASAPERELNRLVDETLKDTQVSPPTIEWKSPELLGNLRIDLYIELLMQRPDELFPSRVELCFEADGAQHFEEIPNRNLEETRRRDAQKAQAIMAAADAGRDISLVALHEDMLTGPAAKRLSSDGFSALTDLVTSEKYSWVFVRPEGYTAMRESPAGTRPRPVTIAKESLTGFEVFVI